jgi:hypothetical protein
MKMKVENLEISWTREARDSTPNGLSKGFDRQQACSRCKKRTGRAVKEAARHCKRARRSGGTVEK